MQNMARFHSGEIPYAYDNLSLVRRCPWISVDYTLAKNMSAYWVNFAATRKSERIQSAQLAGIRYENISNDDTGRENRAGNFARQGRSRFSDQKFKVGQGFQ